MSDTPTQSGARTAGRPRNFDSEAVLDEALELFWQNGFSTTTTRQLESQLGLNQSSIYNLFGSKQNLLELALNRYEQITNAQLLLPLEQANSGLDEIQQFFTNLEKWVTRGKRRGCLLINMMAEDGATTNALTKRTRKYRNRVKRGFKQCLDNAQEYGQLKSTQTELQAELLLGLTLGYNIAARGGASKTELDAMLQAVMAQLQSWRKE